MTAEVILDFVVTMLIVIAPGVVLSIAGICSIDNYLGSIDKAETQYPAAGRD
jgi:hypothetical protein